MNEVKLAIREKYLQPNGIPITIAPTEDGWKATPGLNRPIQAGNALVLVTAKNAKPTEAYVQILETPYENGKIVRF